VSRGDGSVVDGDEALPPVHDPERAIGCTVSESGWILAFAVWFLGAW
jgi:hypothetical protein